MMRHFWSGFAVLIGSFFLVMSSLAEHDLSGHTRYGMPNETNLRLSDLQQTISAGSSRVFAGLCFVAAAVLFSAGGKRPAEKPAEPAATAGGSREPDTPGHHIKPA
jgi:hypothetical protein